MSHRFTTAALVIVLTTAGVRASPDSGQRGGFSGGISSNGILSSSVVGSLQGHGNLPDGSIALDLLVLWRGQPGWFSDARGDQIGSAGSDRDSVHFVIANGRKIELQFDSRARTVRFQDHVIPLREGNVLLLDDVDSPIATVVGLMKVESPFSGGIESQRGANVDPMTAVVRRLPKLFEFLRCEATSRLQCSQMRPR